MKALIVAKTTEKVVKLALVCARAHTKDPFDLREAS